MGGGLRLVARPLDAYVIKDGKVTGRSAFDLTRIAAGDNLVGALTMLVLPAVNRRLRQRRGG